jgi:hypothetical protein
MPRCPIDSTTPEELAAVKRNMVQSLGRNDVGKQGWWWFLPDGTSVVSHFALDHFIAAHDAGYPERRPFMPDATMLALERKGWVRCFDRSYGTELTLQGDMSKRTTIKTMERAIERMGEGHETVAVEDIASGWSYGFKPRDFEQNDFRLDSPFLQRHRWVEWDIPTAGPDLGCPEGM